MSSRGRWQVYFIFKASHSQHILISALNKNKLKSSIAKTLIYDMGSLWKKMYWSIFFIVINFKPFSMWTGKGETVPEARTSKRLLVVVMSLWVCCLTFIHICGHLFIFILHLFVLLLAIWLVFVSVFVGILHLFLFVISLWLFEWFTNCSQSYRGQARNMATPTTLKQEQRHTNNTAAEQGTTGRPDTDRWRSGRGGEMQITWESKLQVRR